MRRRRWGWAVAVVVVAGLLVGAFAAGEAIARAVIRDRVQQAVQEAGVGTADLTVDVPGLVIPQLLAGRIEEAEVVGEGVTYDDIVADVRLRVEDVDTGAMTARDAAVTASLDADALERMLSRASAGTVWEALGDSAEVSIAAPDVALSGSLPVFGARLPLELTLRPAADDGRLLLSPEGIALGEWRLGRDDLGRLPAGVPEALAAPLPVCVSEALPRGVRLSGATVAGERLVVRLALDGDLLNDPSLQRPGDCAEGSG